jgi:GNAT superfamily N-acetyltransferase
MQIVELAPEHWEDAAALAAQRVRRLRQDVPSLPPQYEQPGLILPLIAELAGRVPGVAALEKGQLLGFLFAMSLHTVKGKRGAFSPEWANAARPEHAFAVYQAMYAAIAPRWLANGCYIHALRVMAHDRQGLDGLYWQGFGLNNFDAIRDLSPLDTTVAAAPAGALRDVVFRRATEADIEDVTRLGEGLQRHLASPPIYLAYMGPDTRADHLQWLAQPRHVQWLALREGTAIAEMRREPSNYTACAIAADERTTFITSAYTVPEERSGGIALALLGHLLEDARAEGLERCATDFESANILGARFWMRHFQPTALSVIRYVDERVAYAHAQRPTADFW